MEESQLIPPAEWDSLSVNELIDQKTIIFDKWVFLVEKKYPYAKDLKDALDKIEALIQKRSTM